MLARFFSDRYTIAGVNSPYGRPRGFDRDAALATATEMFWQHGYEATSIAALTEALGIQPPSLYAAFGNKRRLFDAVVARYQRTNQAVVHQALREPPTAREAIERLLRQLADDYTDPAHPPGCLVISAAVNCTPGSADVEEKLRAQREAGKQALTDRIAADVASGLLPPGTDADVLGTFYAAVIQGMSHQARDGAPRSALHAIVDTALRSWPPTTAPEPRTTPRATTPKAAPADRRKRT
jgi:TetR/AcrR family transcriptional regulator, copper-responsive repressor